jgi:hypothetical protein
MRPAGAGLLHQAQGGFSEGVRNWPHTCFISVFRLLALDFQVDFANLPYF